jgi:hypothetical protein
MPQVPGRSGAGVSTARFPNDLFGMLPHPMAFACNYYENDFNSYAAGDWTVAPATGTSALTAGLGGNLTLTTGAVSGNGQGNALNPVSMAFTAGYQTWFGINILCADNLNPNWVVGLTAGGANAPTSGVYFTKATAVRTVNGLINKGGTITTLTGITTVTDAVAVSLGIYYDGKSNNANLYFYSSTGLTGATTSTPSPTAFGQPPVYGGARVAAASNDGLNAIPLTNLPIVNLQPSFFIQTNAASAKTMVVDYVMAACEISRF